MRNALFSLLCLPAFFTTADANDILTNPLRYDGFGAQFQTIVYAVVSAELAGKEFHYTPFSTMEHNYDNDPDFLQKKEKLINFIGNFPLNEDPSRQEVTSFYQWFCESNFEAFANSASLKKIKQIFRANKQREDSFNEENFHIAVHVRRPNPHDCRVEGTNTPDAFFLRMISDLRKTYAEQKPRFHIYSQGDVDVFQNLFGADDTILHLNGSVEETFTSMVLADALVMSQSSFSYTAGLLSEGTVYYLPFWHPPLPHWIPLSE